MFDIAPVFVWRQPLCPPLDIAKRDRHEIPDVDANIHRIARSAPVVMNMITHDNLRCVRHVPYQSRSKSAYAGLVVDVGTDVTGVKTGDRVAVDPNLECGHCSACKRGWAHLCENLGAYGVTTDGGFAEYSVVKATHVRQIGDMPYDIAALAEPLGCVMNGLEAGQAHRAQNALVFGAGPIGLLMAIGMSLAGVKDVSLVDIDESRLVLAESFGFKGVASGSDAL